MSELRVDLTQRLAREAIRSFPLTPPPARGVAADQGGPGARDRGDDQASNWFGVLAPAATPASVVTRLNGEIGRVLQDAETGESMRGQSLEPHSTPRKIEARVKV